MQRQLRPLFDRVVIKELDPDRVRWSGLGRLAGDHEPPPQHGIVLAVAGDRLVGVGRGRDAGQDRDHVFPGRGGRLDRGRRGAPLVCRVGELLGVIEQVTDWEYTER